jgi:cation-transporting ATPase 13A1
MIFTIDDGVVDKVELYHNRHWLGRWDVFPFLLGYACMFFCIFAEVDSQLKYSSLVGIPSLLSLHLIIFLFAQSSVKLRCFIGKSLVKDVSKATFALVKATKNAGKDRIVNVEHRVDHASVSEITVVANKYQISPIFFQFQEVTYQFNAVTNSFGRIDYPVKTNTADTLKWVGFPSKEFTISAAKRWGFNEFNIPLPHFLDLYMEHLVAPFFVFQVVCLFLWSLDDYWYYSVFTLFMLMIFEGVMCKQRQNNVLMMRSMRRPAFQMLAYRNKTWVVVSSEIIFPGDIISITADATIPLDHQGPPPDSSEEGKVVPCDILLLRGHCVVNEAMLTGESIPKMKECIDVNMAAVLDEPGDRANIMKSSKWNRHILLGGTQLQQHSVPQFDDPATATMPTNGIPPPPDRGCIGLVIRTGFATTQGELMRKILFATEGVAANTSETFAFIAVLVCFAVIAASIVLRAGLYDERRNKFRLVLHCIMIITSVVPPELPMELSLAVTNSLAALAKQMIYCTEPFRIPLAGKLNVICFDKTGTLTKDEMNLKGIVAAQDVCMLTGAWIAPNQDRDQLESSSSSPSPSSSTMGAQVLSTDMYAPDITTELVQCILGVCQDLVVKMPTNVQNNTNLQTPAILGDPMEVTAFQYSGFQFIPSWQEHPQYPGRKVATVTLTHPQYNWQALVLQRFAFSSEMKRSGVIVELRQPISPPSSSSSGSSSSNLINEKYHAVQYVFCKGAPEVLHQQGLFNAASLPESYTACSQHHMRAGKRVIALAYRRLPTTSLSHPASLQQLATSPRAQVEKDLLFAGFLVFDSDVKADSRGVIKELHYAQQAVKMITGDSVYTAASVAKKLTIVSAKKPIWILMVVDEPESSSPVKTKDTSSTSDKKLKSVSGDGKSDDEEGDEETTVISEEETAKKVITGQLVWRQMEPSSSMSSADGKKKKKKSKTPTKDEEDGEATSASALPATTAVAAPACNLVGHERHRQAEDVSFSLESVASLIADGASLSVTGPALELLQQLCQQEVNGPTFVQVLRQLAPHVAIFARVSPMQKEKTIHALNATNRLYTMMCGDGTNDVGALKAAHVGVSIVNNPTLEKKVEQQQSSGSGGSASSSNNSVKDRAARALMELQAQEQDPSIVKLGDASIASPFTTKRTSVDSVLAILRQGRCTLVTSIQVYKVLALNCLTSAFMMSALYLRGLKHGDMQMTASGIVIAALFFFLSQAKPLLDVSSRAPPSSVFAPAVYMSILGQFFVHLLSMMITVYLCDRVSLHGVANPEAVANVSFATSMWSMLSPSAATSMSVASSTTGQANAIYSAPDSRFTPNLINTTMFILMTWMQANNFAVNYRGPPFMESLMSHVYLQRSLIAVYATMLIVVGGQFEPFNDFLQLVQLPSEQQFQAHFVIILVANIAACFCIERLCRRLE